MTNKKDDKQIGKKIAIGLAIAGAAAAAYALTGERGKKNRAKIKHWSQELKEEVATELEKIKEVKQEVYDAVIDRLGEKYKNLKNINLEELNLLVQQLKGHWDNLQRTPSKKPAPSRTNRKKTARG